MIMQSLHHLTCLSTDVVHIILITEMYVLRWSLGNLLERLYMSKSYFFLVQNRTRRGLHVYAVCFYCGLFSHNNINNRSDSHVILLIISTHIVFIVIFLFGKKGQCFVYIGHLLTMCFHLINVCGRPLCKITWQFMIVLHALGVKGPW